MQNTVRHHVYSFWVKFKKTVAVFPANIGQAVIRESANIQGSPRIEMKFHTRFYRGFSRNSQRIFQAPCGKRQMVKNAQIFEIWQAIVYWVGTKFLVGFMVVIPRIKRCILHHKCAVDWNPNFRSSGQKKLMISASQRRLKLHHQRDIHAKQPLNFRIIRNFRMIIDNLICTAPAGCEIVKPLSRVHIHQFSQVKRRVVNRNFRTRSNAPVWIEKIRIT